MCGLCSGHFLRMITLQGKNETTSSDSYKVLLFWLESLCVKTRLIQYLNFSHPYITEAERDLIEISLGKRWFLPDTIQPSLSPSICSYSSHDFPSTHQRPTNKDCQNVNDDDCDINIIPNNNEEEISPTLFIPKMPPRQPKMKTSVPWKHIFTSSPFWAIFFCTIPQTYGFYTLLTELPTYLSNVLHYDLNEVSFKDSLKVRPNILTSL